MRLAARTAPVRLVRVGDRMPLEIRDRLALELSRHFGFACETLDLDFDPAAAFDARRNQYHSTALLRGLAAESGVRTLGLTELDLFVPVLTFVFGEAEMPGTRAIVSLHRLREEFYGLPSRPDLLEDRLLKEALHELGHTFGLRHCDRWSCVMASTHSVERLDIKSAEFCPDCRKSLR